MNLSDRRSLELSLAVARELDRNPDAVLEKGLTNIDRWRDQSGAHPHLQEWETIIRQGSDAVRAMLTGFDHHSRQLRSSSPFAGVLNEDVRLEAVRQATAAEPNPGAVSELLRSLRIDGIQYDPVTRLLAERYLIERDFSRTDLMRAIIEHLGDRCPPFLRYCVFPPAGSALERAIAFGVDPTMTLHNMFGLSARERLEQAGRMIATANDLVRLRSERA